MQLIRQKHNQGCGIACIAMVMGLTYQQVLTHVQPQHRWWKFWQTVKAFPLGPVLQSLGAKYNEHWGHCHWIQQITSPSIFLIEYTDEDKADSDLPVNYHAVAWDSQTRSILDPGQKISLPTSYYQDRLCGYYEIIGKCS